jgi:hypothetical protein
LPDIHTVVLTHVPTQRRHEHLTVIFRRIPDVFLELSFPILFFVIVKLDWLDRSACDALKQKIQVAEVAILGRKLAVFVALDVLQRNKPSVPGSDNQERDIYLVKIFKPPPTVFAVARLLPLLSNR